MATNNPGPGTQSSWDTSGFAFSPNTNTLDRESMPSDKAEAARQKSAAVMEALRNGDKGEADRLMGKENKPQGQILPRGPFSWVKNKLSKDGKNDSAAAAKGKGYEESVASSDMTAKTSLSKDDAVVR